MSADPALKQAEEQIERALRGEGGAPVVKSFFDEATFTASHVVHDPETQVAAIIDSVMDYDPASGRTSFGNADLIADYVEAEGLKVEWLLETHAHADHLSAAPYLQQKLGGKIAIGDSVCAVQHHFAKVFNFGADCPCDGSQFDRLFADGDGFSLGNIPAIALHVPGHTPADLAYVIGDAAFVGDTMFMPDYGTARCDFPGGDARDLYRSIRRLMELPGKTRLFLCHDYQAPNRPHYAWETTIAAERAGNIHVREGKSEDEFVAMRTKRDAGLSMPKLILPAVQVNMRAGRLPEPDGNGTSYLKIPLNLF
jgi:glyoxylase-like metal-dependent hydrolase (beta-lactamase superfamily II)